MGAPIPAGQSLLIRTDFRSKEVWRLIEIEAEKLQSPGGEPGDILGLNVINDQALEGSSLAVLTTTVAGGVAQNRVFVADATTMDDPEHPILVVGPETSAGGKVFQTFRVILSQFSTVADNLALANVDFDEFLEAADERGTFRGSRAPRQQREVALDAVLEAARDYRSSSEAIRMFYDFVESRRRRWSVWNILDISDIHSLYTDMLDQDFTQSRELVGLDEFLEAAKQGGRASTVLMPAGGGFWSAILDSDTLAPRAAMLNRR